MLLKPISSNDNVLIVANIFSSSNNTIINLNTLDNRVFFCGSTGFLNIKGAKRSTSYASQRIANVLGRKLYSIGFRFVYIIVRGFGNGRYSSLKGFNNAGLKILSILDNTSVPFNGCKSRKKRRI
jgi:small subunit ribosomal protein S11